MNGPVFFSFHFSLHLDVQRLTKEVKDSTGGSFSYWNHNRGSGGFGGNAATKAISRRHGNATHKFITEVLGNLENEVIFTLAGNSYGVIDGREFSLEGNVDHGAENLLNGTLSAHV